MNTDFRIAVSFTQHPKTKKLIRKLGHEAFYSLINLWSFVAMNKPDGIMTNMDVDDIEIKANFKGKSGTFVAELLKIGFLDKIEEYYVLHNWLRYNPLPKWPTLGKRPNTKTWNKIKKEIFERDNYICKYCGQKIIFPECDHIMPICRGGSNNPNNLTTACTICNKSKGSKLLEEWII